jgi:hypothetical protein
MMLNDEIFEKWKNRIGVIFFICVFFLPFSYLIYKDNKKYD